MDINDSPPISTPRDLAEIPVAIYGEEHIAMDPFRDTSSLEIKADISCWSESPSPLMRFSSMVESKIIEPLKSPAVVKRKFRKQKPVKSKSPRRTSARLSKTKADVVRINEPEVITPTEEPDLRVVSMEACFGDTVSW